MKRKVISLILVMAVLAAFLPVQKVSALTLSDLKTQVSNTYRSACKEAGVASFNGYCARLVNLELVILGINSSTVGGNGNDEYDNYKNLEKSSGGYYITAYPASSCNLASALNEITDNGTKDAYNILVGFETGAGSAGALYGHVVFIHGIIDGKVYFCESFNTTIGGTYYPEGAVIACSIDTFASYYNSWTTLDGVIHFQKEIGYLEKCNSYPSHCVIQISSEKTYLKSLPCSQNTDPGSVNVEIASKGDTYTAIGLYKNTGGNLWYKVTANTGDIGYIYAGDTTFVEQKADIAISGVAAPTELKQGNAFSIKGVISTENQRLCNVGVWVTSDLDGSRKTGTVLEVDTTSYNLYNSAVDYAVKFNDLAAGEYTYIVAAGAKSYYAKSAKEYGTSTVNVVLYESAFSVVEKASCSHSFTYAVTLPNCTMDGYTTYSCTKCGYRYVADHVAAKGHTASKLSYDGTNHWHICHCGAQFDVSSHSGGKSCGYCGYVPEQPTYGNVDGNDSVDYFDAMTVMQYFAGLIGESELIVSAADVDGSGSVDFFDAMYILQYFAGIIDKLPVE